MKIEFPPVETWDANRDVVSFPADVDGNRIICAVSWEALQDNFGGNNVPPVECFKKNRWTLEAKVRTLISKNRFETDGSVLIRSEDGP